MKVLLIVKTKTGIAEKRAAERTAAEVERQGALLDYVAMMADVELPTDAESEADNEQGL